MTYAPILVIVYNRFDHFKKCIESLRINSNADNTILYIASDGPKDDATKHIVDKIRSYIKTISGFKDVIVFAPELNTQKKICFEAIDTIRKTHDRYIVIEDDNICSKYFIDFINDGLEIFKNNNQVIAVCGHNYPGFPAIEPKAIALNCFSPWGYGVWRDKDIHFTGEPEEIIEGVFKDKVLFKKINYGLPHLAPMLRSILKKELIAGDATYCVSLFKNDKVCIFPSYSLVRNTGNDGSGEHCGIDEGFSNQSIYQERIVYDDNKILPALEISHGVWLHNFFGGKEQELKGWLVFYSIKYKSRFLKKCIYLIEFFSQVLSKYIRALKVFKK